MKAESTRSRILITVAELMRQHGANFCTQDVAREAGVHYTLLYRYIGSKEAQINALLQPLLDVAVETDWTAMGQERGLTSFLHLLAEDKYYPLVVAWRFKMDVVEGELETCLFDTFYPLLLMDRRRSPISLPVARYHFAGYLQLIFDGESVMDAIGVLFRAIGSR